MDDNCKGCEEGRGSALRIPLGWMAGYLPSARDDSLRELDGFLRNLG